MRSDDLIRLRHMLDAACQAIEFSKGNARDDLDTDRMLTLALVKCIEIIGEAARHVTDSCRQELTEIPWANIVAMRNRLIHAYFDVNLDVLWGTVTEDLPPLAAALERALSNRQDR